MKTLVSFVLGALTATAAVLAFLPRPVDAPIVQCERPPDLRNEIAKLHEAIERIQVPARNEAPPVVPVVQPAAVVAPPSAKTLLATAPADWAHEIRGRMGENPEYLVELAGMANRGEIDGPTLQKAMDQLLSGRRPE